MQYVTMILSLAFLSCGQVFAMTGEEGAAGLGPVYAYGTRLTVPYEFTGVGTDTLWLNGHVFEAYPQTSGLPIPEKVIERFALFENAGEAMVEASTYLDSLKRFAAVFQASPEVQSVEITPQGVNILWVGDNEAEVGMIPRGPQPPPMTVTEAQEEIISMFWAAVEKGGLFAFGRRYHVTTPLKYVAKTERSIARLEQGEELSSDNVRHTALQNSLFVADLEGRSVMER